jgi:hypothetical protein
MSTIITFKNDEVTTRRVIESLLAQPEVEFPRVTSSITRAIARSFKFAPHERTRTEIRRRFEFAAEMWIELRAEAEMTIAQIDVELPKCLVRRLLGLPWEPEGACKRKDRKLRYGDSDKALTNAFGPNDIDGRLVTHDLDVSGFRDPLSQPT